MSRLLKMYQNALAKRPFTTQVAQTALIMGSGDFLAQKFVEGKTLQEINFKRTRNFFIVGALLVGPGLTVWYRTLYNVVGNKKRYGIPPAIQKMMMDQLLFAPCFNFAILTALGIVDGKTVQETKRFVRNTYPDVMKANYCLWPMVQCITFYAVPLQYQVLFVQTVCLFWNTFLSFKTQASG